MLKSNVAGVMSGSVSQSHPMLNSALAQLDAAAEIYPVAPDVLDCSPSAPVSQIYGCDLRRVLVSSL